MGEEKERTVVGAVLSLFLSVTKRLYGKEREWSIGQIKMCRKKQHVEIDDRKGMSDLICGKVAVGGNYNSTWDMKACKEVVKNAMSLLPTKGSDLDYENYASMGIAANMVRTYASANLSEEQAGVVKFVLRCHC